MLARNIAAVALWVGTCLDSVAQDVTVLQTEKIEVIGKTAVHIQNESEWVWRLAAVVIPIIVAVFAPLFANWLTTQRAQKDKSTDVLRTKVALLHELSSRVVHCVYDYEAPWCAWGTVTANQVVDLKRVKKFKPIGPVMYPPDSATFGSMSAATGSALVNFYTALGRWAREIDDAEHSAVEVRGKKVVPDGDLRRLSRRLGETLAPGLEALTALRDDIGSEADEIIRSNFDAYYRFAVPNDPRSARVGNMQPLVLLAEQAAIARTQKEMEQRNAFGAPRSDSGTMTYTSST